MDQKPLVPQVYDDEHNDQIAQVQKLKKKAPEVESAIAALRQERELLKQQTEAFNEARRKLESERSALQEERDRKEAKILARIDKHKEHHNNMMQELKEASEAFERLLASLRT